MVTFIYVKSLADKGGGGRMTSPTGMLMEYCPKDEDSERV